MINLLTRPVYVAQRVEDLQYRAYDLPFDLSSLRILDTRIISSGAFNLTAHILGASHGLVIRKGDDVFTEVLACLPHAANDPLALVRQSALASWRWSTKLGSIKYQVRGRVARTSAEQLTAWQDRVKLDNPTLLHTFPAGRSGVGSITALKIVPQDDGISIRTYHSYPEDGALAVTHALVS